MDTLATMITTLTNLLSVLTNTGFTEEDEIFNATVTKLEYLLSLIEDPTDL